MTRRSQLGGFASTRAVINFYSTGGTAAYPGASNHFGRELLSGPLTANTFATVLSATGKGEVPLLSCYTKDGTSRTLRLRVTVDGVVVFNPTATTATTTNGAGIFAAGIPLTGVSGPLIQGAPIRYNSSLLVEVASSLTETDKLAIGYVLHQG
jgi:hypothetical protein